MEKLHEKLKREQNDLDELLVKKADLEEKIKKKQESIDKVNGMINQKKFSEMDDVIKTTGLSFDEILNAIRNGDLTNLQDKLDKKETSPLKEN